nr:hypothetical protein HmN_000998900 [Hymenolepis microstoma]
MAGSGKLEKHVKIRIVSTHARILERQIGGGGGGSEDGGCRDVEKRMDPAVSQSVPKALEMGTGKCNPFQL